MKLFMLFFLFALVCSCGHEVDHGAYLEIRYRHPGAMFPMTISCPNMKYKGKDDMGIWYDFKITDRALLQQFYNNYKELKPDEKGETYIDAQAGILFHHGTEVDTLCIDRFGKTVLNGIRQTDNLEFFLLVQDSIEENFEPIREEKYKHLMKK